MLVDYQNCSVSGVDVLVGESIGQCSVTKRFF